MTVETEGKQFYELWRDLSAPYFDWQVDHFRPYFGTRIADVGCGPGTLTPFLKEREYYLAIDHDPAMLEMVRAKCGEDTNCLQADITQPEFRAALQQKKIDTIVSANTIEHIENDRDALRMMAEALPLGGHLCLLVPAFQWLYGTLDSLDGHYRRYTKASLQARLAGLPITCLDMRYFNMVGALGWWVKGRLLKETAQKAENYRLMGQMLPLVKPLERIIPPPFGLSLIAILQRK